MRGLEGVRYRDQAAGVERVEGEAAVAFAGEVDRLYVDAPPRLVVRDGVRALLVESDGFPDVVVWNPGAETARQLDDMEDDAYRRLVCVEAAAAARPVTVGPGERWTGTQRIGVGSDEEGERLA